MLKVTIDKDTSLITFKLEGRIAGEWVDELERAWLEEAGRSKCLKVDLTGVTFIDPAGKEFLAARYDEGAELIVAGCFMRALAAEIENSPKANAQRN